MKTYEEFLTFLEDHLKQLTDFIPITDQDFHPVCFAVARFLLTEPYRWEKLIEAWPNLPEVPKPSKEELIEFFKSQKGLPLSFRKEIKEDNLEVLNEAYQLLYPILVLKDEFLLSIFRTDVIARRFKKVFRESNGKINRIIKKINHFKLNENFLPLVRQFTQDLSGFSLTLINNRKLLDQTVQKFMQK